ncbi:hypothetical protein K456DRAFT_410639 [Colletotrichum gloeosporioides 23]|nr:hypothetical protein K456DRAFT_410639 [Colletotrichum gloeosporioides 23]
MGCRFLPLTLQGKLNRGQRHGFPLLSVVSNIVRQSASAARSCQRRLRLYKKQQPQNQLSLVSFQTFSETALTMSRAGRGEHLCLCITAPVGTSEPLGSSLNRPWLCQSRKELVFHQKLVLMSHDGAIEITDTRSDCYSRRDPAYRHGIFVDKTLGEGLPHRLDCTCGKGNPDRCWDEAPPCTLSTCAKQPMVTCVGHVVAVGWLAYSEMRQNLAPSNVWFDSKAGRSRL